MVWGELKARSACMHLCACIAVTAATCHLFHFKAAGVTQVLWRRGQERRCVPRGDGSLPVREEAADGRQQTGDVPSSAGLVASTAPGQPRLGGCMGGLGRVRVLIAFMRIK